MRYWLMKSEPSEFGIDDLKRAGLSLWDGVRNYQVRNMFRDEMKIGDLALFYHSSTKNVGVVGEMVVAKAAAPDPTQFIPGHQYYDAKSTPNNPRWLGPTMRYINKFSQIVSLETLKSDQRFSDLPFIKKGNRLSVIPITKAQYYAIVKLASKNVRLAGPTATRTKVSETNP